MMKVDVILPAAGTSERMNLPVAKQFLKVLGKHILAYTVDSFHKLPWVRYIVVVVSPDQIEFTKELMDNYGFSRVKVCAGSHTRHRSISCGLQALQSECSEHDVVIIHDAARPFITEHIGRQVAEAALTHGAAGVTRPLVSTVIRGDGDGKLVESLDRRLYRNSEMPQAFHYGVITSAYEKCSEDDLDHGTECLLLALKYSQCQAALVEGTDDLWKVTYQKDIYSLESVVKEKFMVVSVINNSTPEFLALEELHDRLSQRQIKIAAHKDSPANTFVVVWDWQLSPSLENAANRICRLYKQDMPSSAVKLDLMVVIVFLRNTHSVYMQAQALLNKNMNAESTKDHSQPENDLILPADLCVGISSSNSRPSNIEIALGHGSPTCRSSETDNSRIVSGIINHHLHKHCHQIVNRVQVFHNSSGLPASSDLPGDSTSSSSVDNTPFPESEPQSYESSVDFTSWSGNLGSHCVKSLPSLELPTDRSNSGEQQKDGYLTSCLAVVRKMREELERDIGGKFVLAVGVSCGRSPVCERLVELIWQRSLCVDGQVLIFDDCPA